MKNNLKYILIFVAISGISAAIIFYNNWGGNPESKLEKTKINNTDNNDFSDFDNMLSTSWVNDKEDSSTAEISFLIESSPKYTKGYFENFDILFKISDNDPTNSKLKVSIDVSSINTDNSMRDKNLMDEDYFNKLNYPSISFQSKEIIKNDSNYTASGIIDMMGKKSELSFNFEFQGLEINKQNKEVAIFEGDFTIDRVKLGMNHIKSIGDQVNVDFYCELVRK